MLRKAMLTGGIVFLTPGSSTQIICAILICIVALVVTTSTSPFLSASDDVLTSVAHLDLLMTLLGALMLKLQLPATDGYDDEVFEGLLVFFTVVPLTVFVFTVVYQEIVKRCLKLYKARRALRRQRELDRIEEQNANESDSDGNGGEGNDDDDDDVERKPADNSLKATVSINPHAFTAKNLVTRFPASEASTPIESRATPTPVGGGFARTFQEPTGGAGGARRESDHMELESARGSEAGPNGRASLAESVPESAPPPAPPAAPASGRASDDSCSEDDVERCAADAAAAAARAEVGAGEGSA